MFDRRLRLLGEIGLAAILGWIVFVLTTTGTDAPTHSVEPQPRSAQVPRVRKLTEIDEANNATTGTHRTAPIAMVDEATETRFAIRRAVINATAQDVSSRNVNPNDCLAGVELAGPQKIRFEVEVVATATEIRTGSWYFAEIVDGQELPESVLKCTASAFGGNYVISPREHEQFPLFEGVISTLYRID